jgi:hypothetical protein
MGVGISARSKSKIGQRYRVEAKLIVPQLRPTGRSEMVITKNPAASELARHQFAVTGTLIVCEVVVLPSNLTSLELNFENAREHWLSYMVLGCFI